MTELFYYHINLPSGSKLFVGKMDNTEIPKRIAKAGGYK